MPISITEGIINESWRFTYDGEEVELKIEVPKSPHCLFVKNRRGFRDKHPWEVFFRILNEFVWFYEITAKDLNGGHGHYCANVNFSPSDDSYAIGLSNFTQRVFDRSQHLALGFYREGVSGDSAYYAFMCYAKILEIPFKDGRSKGAWIDQEILNLKSEMAISLRDRRVHMLGGKTLGNWLLEDGRHALSHANIQRGSTVRDPNSYQDWDEIKWGNTVMRELAEKVITEILGVATKH